MDLGPAPSPYYYWADVELAKVKSQRTHYRKSVSKFALEAGVNNTLRPC